MQKPISYAQLQLSMTLLNFGLSIFFIVCFHLSWQGRMYGIFLSYFVFLVVGIFILYKHGFLVNDFKKEYIKDSLKFGIPLIPHVIGGYIIGMSDRLFISKMLGNDAVGIYIVGYQIGSIIMILQESFNQAWVPYLFSYLQDINEQKKIKIVKLSYFFSAFFILAVVVLYYAAPVIFKFFIDAKYKEGIQFVLWISLGYAFLGMYKTVTNFIFFMKKTYLLSYLTFLSAAINVTLNYFLIKMYGAIGAAYAAAIGMFSIYVFAWYLSNRVYPMPWFYFLKKQKPLSDN